MTLYRAVIIWFPAASVETLHDALPLLPKATVFSTALPSMNVTVPVIGFSVAGFTSATVAASVTFCP